MTMIPQTTRTAGVAPFVAFAVGVVLLIAAMTVLGLPYGWVNALLLAMLVVALVWVGRRTSWRPRAVAGSLVALVILGSVVGFAFSVAFPSMGLLVEAREDRVLAQVERLASDAGFTALIVPGGQTVVDEWPVGELTDPAGFTLAWGDPGVWTAEHRATGPMSTADLESLVAPGLPIAPRCNQTIPAGAIHQDLTAQGSPAVGLDFVDATGQPASVLVTVIGDVVVRVWLLGEEGLAPLVTAAESLVPLTRG